jgi:hypothetical protein
VPHHRLIAHRADSATTRATSRAVRITQRHLARRNGLPSFVSQDGIDQGQARLPFRAVIGRGGLTLGTKVLFILTVSIKQYRPGASIRCLPISRESVVWSERNAVSYAEASGLGDVYAPRLVR